MSPRRSLCVLGLLAGVTLLVSAPAARAAPPYDFRPALLSAIDNVVDLIGMLGENGPRREVEPLERALRQMVLALEGLGHRHHRHHHHHHGGGHLTRGLMAFACQDDDAKGGDRNAKEHAGSSGNAHNHKNHGHKGMGSGLRQAGRCCCEVNDTPAAATTKKNTPATTNPVALDKGTAKQGALGAAQKSAPVTAKASPQKTAAARPAALAASGLTTTKPATGVGKISIDPNNPAQSFALWKQPAASAAAAKNATAKASAKGGGQAAAKTASASKMASSKTGSGAAACKGKAHGNAAGKTGLQTHTKGQCKGSGPRANSGGQAAASARGQGAQAGASVGRRNHSAASTGSKKK
jgi:hypothetical protein